MTSVTNEEKLREAARELKMRRSVYPGCVKAGQIQPEKRITIQQAIVADCEHLAGERLL